MRGGEVAGRLSSGRPGPLVSWPARHAVMEFRGQEHAAKMPPWTRAPTDASFSSGNNGAAQAGAGSEARYLECLRNHAAAQGGHAVDGCGEFMPPGDDGGGYAHALRCAACGCHRSFHRKDDGHHHKHPRLPLHPATTPRVPPPHPYAASHPYALLFPCEHQHHQSTPSSTTTESSSEERGPPSAHATAAQGQGRRKRFRTRFTAEQKELMLALAERVGWRTQKQDAPLVEHLCAQAGVGSQVFKVWMHNNKHHRRQQQPQSQQQQQQ